MDAHKSIRDALDKMSAPNTLEPIRWQALAYALEQMCEAQKINIDWQPETQPGFESKKSWWRPLASHAKLDS